ncbi:MAG: acyl-CoA thioesterase [Bacillota bacterium]
MFSTTIKITFYDADPAGIMFFGNAFKYAHSAYEELIEGSPYKKTFFSNEKFVVPIVHTEADYLRPLYPNTILRIEVSAGEIRESSFELNYRLSDENQQECVRVRTVHVFVDKVSWKKASIPADLKAFLENLQD